jgi:hypothetical protein
LGNHQHQYGEAAAELTTEQYGCQIVLCTLNRGLFYFPWGVSPKNQQLLLNVLAKEEMKMKKKRGK